jgi:hypothetical protein
MFGGNRSRSSKGLTGHRTLQWITLVGSGMEGQGVNQRAEKTFTFDMHETV